MIKINYEMTDISKNRFYVHINPMVEDLLTQVTRTDFLCAYEPIFYVSSRYKDFEKVSDISYSYKARDEQTLYAYSDYLGLKVGHHK